MIALARFSGVFMSANAAQETVSSKIFCAQRLPELAGVKSKCAAGRLPAIAALIAFERSARCAIAQPDLTGRGRDLVDCGAAGWQLAIAAAARRPRSAIALLALPRPGGIGWRGCAVSPGALSARLTPARWHAKNWVRQHPGGEGSGVAVLARTAPELGENHQAIDFALFCARFWRFSPVASRVMRVCLCVQTRAHAREGNARTTEPHVFIEEYQKVSCSGAVLAWFWLEPARRQCLANGGFLRFSNILGAGYGSAGVRRPVLMPASTVMRGRGGVFFRLGRVADSAGACELGGIEACDQVERNGGFLRVSRRLPESVGRVMLEGWAKRCGYASFVLGGRKPVGLAQEWPGTILANATPYAPIRADALLEPHRARRIRNFERTIPTQSYPGEVPALAAGGETLGGAIGSGLGMLSARTRATDAGRGVNAGFLRGRLRRTINASGSMAHVN